MKMYQVENTDSINAYLKACFKSDTIDQLAAFRYSLQAGMTDLVKQKLDTDKIVNWYLRMLKATEKTAEAIYRKRYPLPGDSGVDVDNPDRWLANKRKRDEGFESFLLKSGY